MRGIKNVEVIAEAEKKEDSSLLSEVHLKLKVSSEARPQLLNAILRKTEAKCPVLGVFREKIPVNVEFEVAKN